MIKRDAQTGAWSRSTQDGGFALLFVLGLVFVLSSGAYVLTSTSRALAARVATEADAAQERLVARSSLIRALYALEQPRDPLHKRLSEGDSTVRWRFADEEAELHVASEATKVDLNHGAEELIRALFAAYASDSDGAHALDVLLERRAAGDTTQDVMDLLPLCARFSPAAKELSAATTVWTGLSSVDPTGMPSARASALIEHARSDVARSLSAAVSSPLAFESDRYVNLGPPVFTLTATVVTAERRGLSRAAVYRPDGTGRRVQVVRVFGPPSTAGAQTCE
jgi:hypothetical protein